MGKAATGDLSEPSTNELVEYAKKWDAANSAKSQSYLWLPGVKRGRVHTQKSSNGMDYAHGWNTPYTDMTDAGEVTTDAALAMIYDPQKRQDILERAQKEGYTINNFDDLQKLWGQAVQNATAAYMGSGKKMKPSPFEMLHLMASMGQNDSRRQPVRGLEFNDTTQQVDFASMAPETARQILTSSLSDALGRAPTDTEIEDFASRANAIVSANPQITNSTAHMVWNPKGGQDGLGAYEQQSVVNQQVGPSGQDVANMVQNEAIDDAQSNPEYGAYQASTTYMNALLQAIMSPTGG